MVSHLPSETKESQKFFILPIYIYRYAGSMLKYIPKDATKIFEKNLL